MLVIWILICCNQQSADLQTAHAFNEQGLILYQKGDFLAALEKFEKARQTAPDVAEYHNNSGMAYLQFQQAAKATEAFESAIALHPEPMYYYNMALARAAGGATREAVQHLEKAVALRPDHVDAWIQLGIQTTNLMDRSKAINSYEKAIALRADPDVVKDLALLYFADGALPRAEALLEKLTFENPDYAAGHFQLGLIRQKQRKFLQAETAYKTVLKMAPDSYKAVLNLALVQAAQQKRSEALNSLENFLRIVPAQEMEMVQSARKLKESLQ